MATRDLPLGTVTFLFSDIEGSTRLLQDLRDRYVDVLEAQQQIIRSTVSENDGREIGGEGDSFFCVFPSAPNAIRAAAAAQSALGTHTWPDGRTVRVRMGLHTGEAQLGGDDYVGIDVHRAARIASAAHGGQVLLSDVTHSLAAPALEGDVSFTDLGMHRLKDLTRAEHIYQLVVAGLQSDFPPPRTLTATAQNMPATMTSFVGRERELTAIEASIDESRLVTLAGAAGVGKTRIAVELGKRLVPAFVDGVTYVPLANLAVGEMVTPHVARSLSVAERADRPAEEAVTDHLRDKDLLLILDNCEQRRDDVARLTSLWLQASPRLRLLVTSREPLAVEGESVRRIGPLPVPEGDRPAETAGTEVVKLFTDRARAVDPDFDEDAWLPEILAIARKLDGIPLAIELAAARTDALTPGQVLARLDDRFALLRGGRSGGLSPHETLEGAIALSHDTLSAPEAALFRRTSVFDGGFSLEAAEALCSDETDLPVSQVLDALTALIRKSLVVPTVVAGRSRYSLYESIREYAAMQLREVREWDEIARRHQAWFSGWAEDRAVLLRGREQLEALADLEADHRNLQAVLKRSWDGGETEAALSLAATLVWFWYLHGHYATGEHWSGLLLSQEAGNATREQVRLMIGSAEFDYRLGHHDRANTRLLAAIQAAKILSSRSLEMWAYSHLATNHLLRGAVNDAVEAASASLAIAEELGDIGAAAYAAFVQAGAEAWVAWTAEKMDTALAVRLGERLAPVRFAVRELGDRNMTGHALQITGMLAEEAGAHGDAVRDLDEAITAFGEIGNAGCAAHCLEGIAAVLVEREPESAVTLLSAAASLREVVGAKLPEMERAVRDIALDRCRQAMTGSSFDAAWGRGKGSTLSETVASARGVLNADPPR